MGYLSAARSSIKTFEYFRDFKNAKETGDVRRMSERAFLGLSTTVASGNSASSSIVTVTALIGKEFPKIFVQNARITAFASSFLSMLYTGYKLGHECLFSHRLQQFPMFVVSLTAILGTTSAATSILYVIQSLAYKCWYDTYKQDIKDVLR